jgi:hypothetical protein
MAPVRKLYFGGVDVGSWARRRSLQNATRTYRDADTFSIEFTMKNAAGTAFPAATVLVGGTSIWFGLWDSANHANDRNLFAGRFRTVEGKGTSENVKGTLLCTFATPIQELKNILEDIAFDPTVQDTDIKRVVRLGVLAPLPEWDFTSGVSATPSITYPSGAGFEPLTEYEQRSYEYILNDIATDPGQPGDAGYPVRTRRWWIAGKLTTPATPSAGVTYVLHYQDATPRWRVTS